MEEEKKLLTVSASPHVKSPATVRGIMLDVIISLIPAVFAGVAVFGFRAALVIAVCVISCVVFELIAVKIMKKPMCIGDLSAVITGLLLAFNLPVTIPIWMCVLGSFVAIVVVKQLFGGIGQNFANPAITARIVLLVSFASAMTNFTAPKAVDAVSTATPLAHLGSIERAGDITAEIMKKVGSGELPDLLKMFFGVRAGCIGEVCGAALLLGAIYLMIRRVISPIIPCCFIGTVAVMMFVLSHGSLYYTVYEVLGGGLLLGAFFMATDYATSR